MNFNDAVSTCLKKYFTFSGRGRRSEYWWFYLFTLIIGIFAAIIDGALFGWDNLDTGPIGSLSSLVLLIPSLSAGWRRLHDTGRSGWWIGGGFLAIIPIVFILVGVGSASSSMATIFAIIIAIAVIAWLIAILVFMCQDSHHGDNIYGPSPKYNSGASVFD